MNCFCLILQTCCHELQTDIICNTVKRICSLQLIDLVSVLHLSLTDVRLGWSDCWQEGQRGGWRARRADKRAIVPPCCQSQSCQRCAQIPGSTDSSGQARLPATFLGESQWRAQSECKLTIWDFSRQRHQFNIFDLLQQPVKDELP